MGEGQKNPSREHVLVRVCWPMMVGNNALGEMNASVAVGQF